MKATRTRIKGHQWCRLEVELHDGRLSICGSSGRVLTTARAKREALEYWLSFFDENPEELRSMNERCGTNYRSPRAAARYVLDTDGEFHGLDVDGKTADGRVLVTESAGQIVDELRAWFPEVAPYLKWHLNDMHAECEHQEARGETYATHPSAECPDCGYRLGSAWRERELPADVIAWARSLSAGTAVL